MSQCNLFMHDFYFQITPTSNNAGVTKNIVDPFISEVPSSSKVFLHILFICREYILPQYGYQMKVCEYACKGLLGGVAIGGLSTCSTMIEIVPSSIASSLVAPSRAVNVNLLTG